MSLQVFNANIYKYFITIMRAYPKSFFISSLLTIFFSLLYSYLLYYNVFNGSVDVSFISEINSSNYLAYIFIGLISYSYTVSIVLSVGRSLITERRQGTLESVIIAPYNRLLYFLSYAIAQVAHKSIEMLVIIPFILVFGIEINYFSFFEFSIISVVAIYSLMGFSLTIASLMLYTRDTYISQNTLFTLMFFICGINFPISYLPEVLQYISEILPLTHIVILFRVILIEGAPILNYSSSLLKLIFIGTLYLCMGLLTLRRVEKIALEEIGG